MLIRIEDAVTRFKTKAGLARALGLPRQSISNRLRMSDYLTDNQALKLHRRHPVITRELLALAKDRK